MNCQNELENVTETIKPVESSRSVHMVLRLIL
jgi:hypothetical protein